jgi:TolA-binding protein
VSVRGAGDQAVAHRAARLLAQARRAGIPERPLEALMEAQRQLAVEGSSLRAALKQADHLLLAGDYREARASFWKFLRENPLSALVWGKLLRCVLFTALPPARPLCFRAAA